MRRFFRAHRDEDYSQIQYLTAKCNRLAHDKALLERECLLARDRDRVLRSDLAAVATHLLHQQQVNLELTARQEQLFQRQERADQALEESSRDAQQQAQHLTQQLEQVRAELLCLQHSEGQLEGLVDELHAEAQQGAALAEGLWAELRGKTAELQELHILNKKQTLELKELHSTTQRTVQDLQRENQVSLEKLQETVEQFEWVCKQQRCWVLSVRRLMDGLTREKETLVQQVGSLQVTVASLTKGCHGDGPTQTPSCPLQAIEWEHSERTNPPQESDPTNLQPQMCTWRGVCGGSFIQAQSIAGYQKPP